MSNLESIVPPLELCKRIPAGEFEDSALVWCRVRGKDMVYPFEQWIGFGGMPPIPAPTLEEILDALGDLGSVFCKCWIRVGNNFYEYPIESEEALQLWFKVKGIEVEK